MTNTPPPGWYPAPDSNGTRYWTGTAWAPALPVAAAGTAAAVSRSWKPQAIAGLIVSVVLFILFVLSLSAYSGASSRANNAEEALSSGGQIIDTGATAELEARAAELNAREQALAEQEAALAEQENAPGEWVTTSIVDGIYTIGTSTEPGVYRTEQVGEYCQWNLYKTGTGIYEPGGTINFGAGEPGPIQVTLSEGQDFSSSDCGTWERIG